MIIYFEMYNAAFPCRLIASYFTTLYLLSLEVDEDVEEEEREDFLARRSNASLSAISALMFYEPTAWIITGDQQGNGT